MSLAAWSAMVFLVPLLAAMAGAYLAGRWWARESSHSLACWQTAGAVGGLVLAALAARLVLGFMMRRRTGSSGA